MITRLQAFVAAAFVALAIGLGACAAPPDAPPPAAPVAIAIDEAATAARLAEAVRIETISWGDERSVDGAAFLALHKHLAANFPRVHATLKRDVIGNYSLLYTWTGSDASLTPILLMGHLDVVPVEPRDETAWRHPAFSGDIVDGLVWGRGTLDDKVTVLGLLEAVEHLLTEGAAPRRTVYLAFGHDEELTGRYGAGRIAASLEARGVRLDFVLDEGGLIALTDVTGTARPAALIGVAEKGYASIELIVQVEGGHSARPPAETAIGLLAWAIERLEKNPMPAELREPTAGMLNHLAADMSFLESVAVESRWLLEPLLIDRLTESPSNNALVRTTIAPTIIAGGTKDNVLPREARAVVNARILPGDTVEQTLAHVQKVIAEPRIALRLLDGASEPSSVSDADSAAFTALRKSVEQIFPGIAVAPSLVIAATDSRHFSGITENVYRFLPVPFDANDLGRFHGTNERISIRDYGNVVRFYIQLLRNAAL